MIQVVDVTQHYGIRPVLRCVNFHVREGELVVLMGPNGMGKSTLMGVIAGVLAPQRGYVEIGGMRRRRSPEEESAIRKRVYYLPDHPWLPSFSTGREFLMAIGRLYEIEDLWLLEHVDRLMQLFDLKEKADSAISSYSNGQQKKIAICAALVSEAEVMLLDEPFSGGLDPSALLALRHVLLRLSQQECVTIVMATPVPELVEGLASRVAVLRDGEIIAFDSPDGLKKSTGSDGSLEAVLENLIHPRTLENIERYFEGRES